MAGSADIGVVGAGIVGLSTAYALRERGVRVTLYERGVPGNGQSGGQSRIFRHIHDDPRLVAFARRSHAAWREWEERSGRELLTADGVVALGPSATRRVELLRAADVPARLVHDRDLRELLPALAPFEGEALLDELGGVLRTTTAVDWLTEQLRDALVADEVVAVTPTDRGTAQVRAGGTLAEHDRVTVCAGRGTAPLARGAGVELPIRQSAHVRLAFAVSAAPPSRLACLLDGSDAFGEPSAYGDPLPGNAAYAIGVDEASTDGEGALAEPDGLGAIAARTARYVARALPGLAPEPVDVRHCWITELPWAHDAFAVFDAGAAAFFAGHNVFKHAPALGRALAAHALGEPAEIALDPADRLGEA